MKQVTAKVIFNKQLWGEHWVAGHRKYLGARLLNLKCPEVSSEAQPGQFVMVNCGGECLLPRPFSIYQVSENGITLFTAVLVDGKGTNWLSKRHKGDLIGLFGPLGNTFSVDPSSENLLLVAGGNGIAPIKYLAQKAFMARLSIRLLYGTHDYKRCPMSEEIELISATEDGSVGHRGTVTDLLPEYVDWADQIFACGPVGMYQTMAQMPVLRNKSVQVSLEVRMGCGRGVCYGCTIRTKQGLKRVCQDGPVFNLEDILWDEIKL